MDSLPKLPLSTRIGTAATVAFMTITIIHGMCAISNRDIERSLAHDAPAAVTASVNADQPEA